MLGGTNYPRSHGKRYDSRFELKLRMEKRTEKADEFSWS
jgi:hypothetical protein